jgi:hypothetical protein
MPDIRSLLQAREIGARRNERAREELLWTGNLADRTQRSA